MYFALAGGVIMLASAFGTGAVWALDLRYDARYWNVSEQTQFEKRQLRRDVKHAELVCQETGNEADCAYYEYLKEDLESLQ
jgi:shikimate kinase